MMNLRQNPVNFDQPIPTTAVELLLVLVDTAERYQMKTVPCREVWRQGQPPAIVGSHALPHPKDPLGSLEKLGLIQRLNPNKVRLRAVAFGRAKYERKNWLGKLWLRLLNRLILLKA